MSVVIIYDSNGDPIFHSEDGYIYLLYVPDFCPRNGVDEDLCVVGVNNQSLNSLTRAGTDEEICDFGDRI